MMVGRVFVQPSSYQRAADPAEPAAMIMMGMIMGHSAENCTSERFD